MKVLGKFWVLGPGIEPGTSSAAGELLNPRPPSCLKGFCLVTDNYNQCAFTNLRSVDLSTIQVYGPIREKDFLWSNIDWKPDDSVVRHRDTRWLHVKTLYFCSPLCRNEKLQQHSNHLVVNICGLWHNVCILERRKQYNSWNGPTLCQQANNSIYDCLAMTVLSDSILSNK